MVMADAFWEEGIVLFRICPVFGVRVSDDVFFFFLVVLVLQIFVLSMLAGLLLCLVTLTVMASRFA